jgi:hypothetical protein
MDATGDAINSGVPITENVSCERCGYNLRGLTVPGRCPECGTELEPSVRAHERNWRDLLPPDPVWAGKIRAGVCIALIALVLMLLPFFFPHQWFGREYRNVPFSRTPGRVAALSIECVAWTLTWAAAWRLGSREPAPNGPAPSGKVVVTLRWLSTAYLLLPFAWAWATWDTQYPEFPRLIPHLVLLLGGLLVAFALFWRVGQLLRRRGAWLLALLARLLAVAVPLGTLVALSPGFRFDYDDPSPLGLMATVPQYPFGSPAVLFEVMRDLAQGSVFHFWVWFFALPPVMTLLLLVRIWFAYRPSAIAPDE